MQDSIAYHCAINGDKQCSPIDIHCFSLPPSTRSQSLARMLLIITLVSSVFTLRNATAQLPADMCDTAPCRACVSKCPNFKEQKNQLQDCTKKLAFAKTFSLSAAKRQCKVKPCLSILLKSVCGLLRGEPIPRKRYKLLAALDKAKVQAKEDVRAYQEKTKKLVESQDFKRQTYYRELMKALAEIHKSFTTALNIRATYVNKTQYMSSVQYRQILQQVDKLQQENNQLFSDLRFWYTKNKSLSEAVSTSTLGLKAARDVMHAEYVAFAGDAMLAEALRKANLNKEQRAEVLIQLRERASWQLKNARTLIAKVRAERRFIRKAQDEIFNMLTDIFQRIQTKEVQVPCGTLALSDMVTDNLMETTANNIDDE